VNLVCDLGTTNVRAAVAGSGNKIINEPCVIAFDSLRGAIIGVEAYRMIGRNPDAIEIVTPMEGGVVKHLESVVEIMKHCVKRLTRRGSFTRKFNLTLSIPSGLTQVEQKALKDAGRLAGARDVKLVNSTVAAAVAVGLPIESPIGCLVMNLGSGVTEAALLSMKGVVASHWVRTGGHAIDEAIVERLKKEYSFLLGLHSAEELKREVCNDRKSNEFEVRGRNLKTGLPDCLTVPRSVVDEQLSSYCDTIIELIGHTISACPPELVGDIIERGIALVGGGANISGLVSELSTRLEVPVMVPEDPETCVIRGLLQGQRSIQRNSVFDFSSIIPAAAAKEVGGGEK